MSYHNTSSSSGSANLRSSAKQGAVSAQSVAAPSGFHYMPDGSLMADSAMVNGTKERLNIINDLRIDTSEMPTAETTRRFRVLGDVGSKFTIFITKNDTISYYDFTSGEFTLGHNSINNNLKITLTNKTFDRHITFPTGGGEFNITLTTGEGTELLGKKTVINKKIDKQSSNATVTLAPLTSNTTNYASFPTVTSTGALADTSKVAFDWDITNASSDAGGFGLIPTGRWKNLNLFTNLWFFTTTETVDGAVSLTDTNSGYLVKVDDLADIGRGSIITSVSSGSLSGQPVVRSINTTTKEIELSIPQAFADGITLTFRAYGTKAINEAIGVRFEYGFEVINPVIFQKNQLSKTVRAGSSGDTINLNGTYGVGHNGVYARIGGVGITTASVVSVTASSTAGSLVASVSQGSLTVGTNITFSGIVQVFNVVGAVKLLSYPSSNKTIHLDVDQFLTPGTED